MNIIRNLFTNYSKADLKLLISVGGEYIVKNSKEDIRKLLKSELKEAEKCFMVEVDKIHKEYK